MDKIPDIFQPNKEVNWRRETTWKSFTCIPDRLVYVHADGFDDQPTLDDLRHTPPPGFHGNQLMVTE